VLVTFGVGECSKSRIIQGVDVDLFVVDQNIDDVDVFGVGCRIMKWRATKFVFSPGVCSPFDQMFGRDLIGCDGGTM
jgi:hypothetical protein